MYGAGDELKVESSSSASVKTCTVGIIITHLKIPTILTGTCVVYMHGELVYIWWACSHLLVSILLNAMKMQIKCAIHNFN